MRGALSLQLRQTVGIVHRISLKDSGPRRSCPRDEIEVATPVEAGRSIELPLDMRNSGRLRIELEYSDLLGTRYLQRTCHVRLPDGTYYCRQYEEKNPGRLEGEFISNYRERIRGRDLRHFHRASSVVTHRRDQKCGPSGHQSLSLIPSALSTS